MLMAIFHFCSLAIVVVHPALGEQGSEARPLLVAFFLARAAHADAEPRSRPAAGMTPSWGRYPVTTRCRAATPALRSWPIAGSAMATTVASIAAMPDPSTDAAITQRPAAEPNCSFRPTTDMNAPRRAQPADTMTGPRRPTAKRTRPNDHQARRRRMGRLVRRIPPDLPCLACASAATPLCGQVLPDRAERSYELDAAGPAGCCR